MISGRLRTTISVRVIHDAKALCILMQRDTLYVSVHNFEAILGIHIDILSIHIEILSTSTFCPTLCILTRVFTKSERNARASPTTSGSATYGLGLRGRLASRSIVPVPARFVTKHHPRFGTRSCVSVGAAIRELARAPASL